MPIKTMWETSSFWVRRCFRISSTCSTISDEVRLRKKPFFPEAQNAQRAGQPTCDETQTVLRCPDLMRTDSMALLSWSRHRNFVVSPSEESTIRIGAIVCKISFSFSCCLRTMLRFVISSHVSTACE